MPFQDVVGHGRLLSLLARAVRRESLPPSMIFAGPSGVGKRKVAIALAQAVNCLEPIILPAPDAAPGMRKRVKATRTAKARDRATFEFDACGVCVACKRIARGVHTDVLTIQPGETGSIKIDQVREAVDRSGYRPFEGRRRVVVVDEADAMVPEAQNALLKTLEEPPSTSLFVLVSARPDALLATVRSRCPRLRFGRLTAAEIASVLIESHHYAETEARAAAAAADGSLGRALMQRSGELAEARDAARQVLDRVESAGEPKRRLDLARAFVTRPTSVATEREALGMRLRALSSLIRDLGILSTSADDALLANADLKPALDRLASAYNGERAARAFSAVDRALEALESNVSPKLVADWLVLQL